MKKKLCLILCLIFLFCGCTNQIPNLNIKPLNLISDKSNSYFMDLTLDTENGCVYGKQKTNYVNTEDKPIDHIYIQLYPNMYSCVDNLETVTMDYTYPSGYNKGNIFVESVSVNGDSITPVYEDNNKLMKLSLPEPVPCGTSVLLSFEYKVTLPKARTRMGYMNDNFSLTNFYPVVAVYDKAYKTSSYSYIGDPFFTDISDYYVNLTLPKEYNIGSTGEYIEIENEQDKTVKITAKNVRDVAIVASKTLMPYQDYIGNTKVISLASNKDLGSYSLSIAKDALSYFNSTFGTYPYSTLTVVQSELYGGGMEYPNLVLITKDLYNENSISSKKLEWVIAHEIAHQWWYGVVGNDPINDCFVDESLTEYSTLLYMQNKYDEDTFSALKDTFIDSPYKNYEYLITDPVIHKSTKDFSSSFELSMLVYLKGTLMYSELAKDIGSDTLNGILKSYYQNNAYSIVTSDDLISHFNKSYDYDFDKFFNKWLYNK